MSGAVGPAPGGTGTRDRFADARTVADAVLYEGYLLYPYRASSRKNQVRWQFGVLVPRRCAEADRTERWSVRTECIVDPGHQPVLTVRARCLHVQHRAIEAAVGDHDGGTGFAPVESLELDGARWIDWDEAVDREIEIPPVPLLPLAGATVAVPFELPGGEDVEVLTHPDGTVAGRLVRRREPIAGLVRVEAVWADGPGALIKVAVTIENASEWYEPGGGRGLFARHSLVAVHTLMALDDGDFLSKLDPPNDAVEALAGCASEGTYPVLIGPEGSHDLVLSSPIILYDHPAIAPESQGDLFDGLEIDEILQLRIMTLTDAEKAEARGTDPRAAAILDRTDDMPPEIWSRLHGAVRSLGPVAAEAPADEPADEVAAVQWWDPEVDAAVDPWTDSVTVAGVEIAKGAKVRLNPTRRSDAHDFFYAGMDATVAGVFEDVDGETHVAVTIDGDPAGEEFDWQGRYLFFFPEEVIPRTDAEAGR
ncbi:MAG: hypothetical protein ACT4PW_09555 [Acidimicrobiia bacterium]